MASSSKLLSMVPYISLIDFAQYQKNSTKILFEFSNQGLCVRLSPDFFSPANSDTVVHSHNQVTFSDV